MVMGEREEREEREEEEAERDDSERVEDEGEMRGEEGESTEGRQGEDSEDRDSGGARRARPGAPAFSNEDEMEMLEFVQAHTVLYAKEHVHFVDKAKNDRLWDEIGERVGGQGKMSNISSRVNAPGTASSMETRQSQTQAGTSR